MIDDDDYDDDDDDNDDGDGDGDGADAGAGAGDGDGDGDDDDDDDDDDGPKDPAAIKTVLWASRQRSAALAHHSHLPRNFVVPKFRSQNSVVPSFQDV